MALSGFKRNGVYMPSRSRLTAALSFSVCALLLAGCSIVLEPTSNVAKQSLNQWLPAQPAQRTVDTQNVAVGTTASKTVPNVVAPNGPLPLFQHPDVDCNKEKCVALTFDDGPGRYTERLLNQLKEANVPATFYLLGQNAPIYPKTVQRMVREGHQLGNHTLSHKSLTTLSKTQVSHEVQDSAKKIKKVAGTAPDTMRPPYGARNKDVDSRIDVPLVLWDVDTLDWQHRDPKKTVKIAMNEVSDGSIILMHDIHESSVKAVPNLIKKLKKKGYKLVTVNELFADKKFEGSKTYARRT